MGAGSFLLNDDVNPDIAALQASVTALSGSVRAGVVQRQTATLSLLQLKAAGHIIFAYFNVGPVLPANARLLGAEVNVVQALAGIGLVSAAASLQGTGDADGSILAGVVMTAIATSGPLGANPYLSRAGQQITIKISMVALTFDNLTAGSLAVNLFYTQTP